MASPVDHRMVYGGQSTAIVFHGEDEAQHLHREDPAQVCVEREVLLRDWRSLFGMPIGYSRELDAHHSNIGDELPCLHYHFCWRVLGDNNGQH